MAENDADGQGGKAPGRKRRRPLFVGLVLLVLGSGAGFGLVYAGLLPGGSVVKEAGSRSKAKYDDVAFVPVDPLIVPVGDTTRGRVLRFKAQLEVVSGTEGEVSRMMPRVLDVLNSYLRAVDLAALEDPGALVTLRAQMLRRVQIVIGDGSVSDLLVSEFVLN